MTYDETLSYIHAVQWAGHKPGLARTETLLAALGNPEKRLKFVHIAGTNGKGSTAAMTASCLQKAGYKVGLYTSPYIMRFNERMQINSESIPDETLINLVETIRPFAEAMTDIPTEFELITAIGMLYFAQEQCDIVVLEVGLGGTLDSTNVIPCPEVAIITALGLDHTAELGNTIADIARAKAGVIKKDGTVVYYGETEIERVGEHVEPTFAHSCAMNANENEHTENTNGESAHTQSESPLCASDVIARVCSAQNATLTTVNFDDLRILSQNLDGISFDFKSYQNLHIPLLGTYQPCNAALTICALEQLQEKGWHISQHAIYEGLASVAWPGRFELLCKKPPFLLDGSHNPHGMRATATSLRAQFPGQKFIFILSVMADKDRREMLDILCPLAEKIIAVTAPIPRALPAQTLAKEINARCEHPALACACETIPDAIALAHSTATANGKTTTPICALGTLYFSTQIRDAVFAYPKTIV